MLELRFVTWISHKNLESLIRSGISIVTLHNMESNNNKCMIESPASIIDLAEKHQGMDNNMIRHVVPCKLRNRSRLPTQNRRDEEEEIQARERVRALLDDKERVEDVLTAVTMCHGSPQATVWSRKMSLYFVVCCSLNLHPCNASTADFFPSREKLRKNSLKINNYEVPQSWKLPKQLKPMFDEAYLLLEKAHDALRERVETNQAVFPDPDNNLRDIKTDREFKLVVNWHVAFSTHCRLVGEKVATLPNHIKLVVNVLHEFYNGKLPNALAEYKEAGWAHTHECMHWDDLYSIAPTKCKDMKQHSAKLPAKKN